MPDPADATAAVAADAAADAGPGGESTGELLMGAARAMRREMVEVLAADDITPGQARTLRLLVHLGTARPSTLAEHLCIAPRSVTEVVDSLEERGWVERRPDPADRRAVDVVPTPEGLALHAALGRRRAGASGAYLSRLAPADRAELDRILRLLAAP